MLGVQHASAAARRRNKDESMESQDMLSKVIRSALAHTHAPETTSHVQTPLLPKQSSCQKLRRAP
jgi:hypothetical protein